MVGIVRIEPRLRTFFGRKGAEQHGHADRGQHPAAGTLEDPEGHQLVQTCRQTAERRGTGKDDDGVSSTRLPPKRSPSHPDAGMKMDKLTR